MGITLLWITAPHRFLGGEILAEWLDDIGCVLVYLPTYPPELNPIELAFNKLKTVLHRVDYRDLLRDNLHIAVYEALKQFTASDMYGFYKHVNYIRLIDNLQNNYSYRNRACLFLAGRKARKNFCLLLLLLL